MRAYVLIKDRPLYRRAAFVAGLQAAGYAVTTQPPGEVQRADVLVVWNRYGMAEQAADAFEARGGTVLVAENGYLDPERHGHRSWYALAIGGHNGQGRWSIGTPPRWERLAPKLGAEVKPWRKDGGHVLVCPNRSFGRRGFVMPHDWAEKTAIRLHCATGREVRIRHHPGNDAPRVPLEQDLAGCWGVAVWSSSAGVKALLAGIPVLAECPAWILKGAASARLDAPDFPERAPALERLAWAQWHVEEIARGEPFRHLLPAARQGEVAAAV